MRRRRRPAWPASARRVVGALGAPTAGAAQRSGTKVLRYAFPIAETGFDPAQVIDLYSRIVTSHIFEALYTYDHLARPFKIKPNTAAGDARGLGGLPHVWTVRMQPGIYFADDPAFGGKRRELHRRGLRVLVQALLRPALEVARRYATLSELKILGLDELRAAALKDKTAVRTTTRRSKACARSTATRCSSAWPSRSRGCCR